MDLLSAWEPTSERLIAVQRNLCSKIKRHNPSVRNLSHHGMARHLFHLLKITVVQDMLPTPVNPSETEGMALVLTGYSKPHTQQQLRQPSQLCNLTQNIDQQHGPTRHEAVIFLPSGCRSGITNLFYSCPLQDVLLLIAPSEWQPCHKPQTDA